MSTTDLKITTEMLWQGALLFALIDAVFMPLLVWRVRPETFRQARWSLAVCAGIIWFGIWRWAIGNYWDTVYIYVFPAWGESALPLTFGLLMSIVALGLRALALRFGLLHPVLVYCLLGGLWGVLTHTWAVYRGVVTKPPMLQGASPVAAVVIAFFEYMFYWCAILSLAVLLNRGLLSLRGKWTMTIS